MMMMTWAFLSTGANTKIWIN